MSRINWLHLSDWHQGGKDFDRKVVRDALIADIEERVSRIDPALDRIDFVVFSGDLAAHGHAAEYETARQELLDPVLGAVGLFPNRLFMVPGNHDLARDYVYEMLPVGLQHPLDSNASIQKWLTDDRLRKRALEPFIDYRKFVTNYTGQPNPDYASVLRFVVDGKKVALLGINSAWMSGRHKEIDRHGNENVSDARYLAVGEPQIHDRLRKIKDADIRIAVLHHPFDWLVNFDRNRVERTLMKGCHFILRGHEHNPQVHITNGTSGDCIVIPSGASYERRIPEEGHANAYNWVSIDLSSGQGTVWLRRWSNSRCEWIEDIDAYPDGKFPLKGLPITMAHEYESPYQEEASGSDLPVAVECNEIPPAAPSKELESGETVSNNSLSQPIWAVDSGKDQYGPWITFEFHGVYQRLRWCPPGKFMMGSPDNEPKRFNHSHPQHEVTLSKGFWLFDTPVTQKLWQAVMGNNPSRFKSPDRPVECVSWGGCQKFLKKINDSIIGLDLVLPSEAQWEYASRAGVETALFDSSIEFIGANNAPHLDPIAWYGGNSGVDFELGNGWDSSSWLEKQYPDKRAGTHPVRRKKPNSWGLYDMLGNVWEWTQDQWRDNYQDAPANGISWEGLSPGTGRVFRGGSWSTNACSVRTTSRRYVEPSQRNNDLGFRCVSNSPPL